MPSSPLGAGGHRTVSDSWLLEIRDTFFQQPEIPVVLLKKALTWFLRIYDLMIDSTYYFACALLMFLAVAVGYSVFMRRILENPIGWVFDNGGNMLLFICFLSAAKILKDNGHARMTLLLERVSSRTILLLNGLSSTVAVIICAITVWYTGVAVIEAIQEGQVYREVDFPIHRAILWWVIPFGFLTLSIQFLRMSIENLGGYYGWFKDKEITSESVLEST